MSGSHNRSLARELNLKITKFGHVNRIIFPCRPVVYTGTGNHALQSYMRLPQGPVGGPVPVGGDARVPRRLSLPHGPGPHGLCPGLHSPRPRGQGLTHSQVMAENWALLTGTNG